MKSNLAEDRDSFHQEAMAVDALYWAESIQMKFGGQLFTLKDHDYQKDMFRGNPRQECEMKGAQMGGTIRQMTKRIHSLIYGRYPQGVMYLFPTTKTVRRFSQSRFTPLIDDNPVIAAQIPKTDNLELKRVGSSNLYFTGGRVAQKLKGVKKTSVLLKSEPVDCVVFDEYDEMDPAMIDLAMERMSHSKVQEWAKIGTPTIPDWGIDKEYLASDQRVWMIPCDKCKKETCLELEFPNCLHEMNDGKVIRLCIHCHDRELDPRNGHWITRYPDIDYVGHWISQLNSMYVDPTDIWKLFNDPPNGNIAEVYNSKLAQAYIASENRLTMNDIYNICGLSLMLTKHPGPTFMGVDVGRELYVVIAHHPTEYSTKVDKVARVSNFHDVHDLAKRFNVQSAVIDLYPEPRKVREFQENEPYEIFLCDYQEYQRNAPAFNSKTGIVTMNRTEICDASHDLVKTPGRYIIPRLNDEIEKYAAEMSNMAKVLEEEDADKGGSKTYHYRKLGDDHYRHATNYMMLAAMRVGIYEPEFEKDRPKDKWDESFGKQGKKSSWMGS